MGINIMTENAEDRFRWTVREKERELEFLMSAMTRNARKKKRDFPANMWRKALRDDPKMAGLEKQIGAKRAEIKALHQQMKERGKK